MLLVRRRTRFFYGWIIVAVAMAGMFAGSSAATSVFSVFIHPLSEEFGWSRTLISGALAVGTLGTAAVTLIAGRLVDKYGPRLLSVIAALSLGGGLIALSLTRTIPGFYLAFGLMRMVGFGIERIACPTVVANWFIKKRGRALAIISIGSAAGIGIMPPLAQAIMGVADWRTAALVLALIILVLLPIPAWLFMRRRPEDVGLTPDGEAPAAAALSRSATAPALEDQWTLREAMRTRALWLLIVATFLANLGSAGVTTHLIPFLIDQGIPATKAASTVSIYAVFWAGTVLGWGMLAERIAPRRLLAAVFFTAGIAIGILALTRSLPMAYVYGALYGVTMGAMNTLESVMWANYYGRTSLGTIRGFAIPFQQVALSIGPLLTAVAYDVMGSYQVAFGLMALASALSSGIILLAKPPQKRLSSAAVSVPTEVGSRPR